MLTDAPSPARLTAPPRRPALHSPPFPTEAGVTEILMVWSTFPDEETAAKIVRVVSRLLE